MAYRGHTTLPWHTEVIPQQRRERHRRGSPDTVCVFITEVPITKLFEWGEGDSGGHVLRETTSRGLVDLGHVRNPVLQHRGRLFSLVPLVWESNPVPNLQGAWCNLKSEPPAQRSLPREVPACVCFFITAGPIIKLFAWEEGDGGEHVL